MCNVIFIEKLYSPNSILYVLISLYTNPNGSETWIYEYNHIILQRSDSKVSIFQKMDKSSLGMKYNKCSLKSLKSHHFQHNEIHEHKIKIFKLLSEQSH